MTGSSQIHADDEERLAAEIGRGLEALAARSGIRPPAGFPDRVMAAVADEPLPQPARAFRTAVVAGRLRAALGAVGDAWRVVVGGSTPLGVRAQALALVLVVAIGSLGAAGGAAVGAINVLTANPTPRPSLTTAPPSELQSSPSPSPSPSTSPSPDRAQDASPSANASERPESTETPGATRLPETATPRATGSDDHGGGSDGEGGNETPSPTATGTNDHGGGGR